MSELDLRTAAADPLCVAVFHHDALVAEALVALLECARISAHRIDDPDAVDEMVRAGMLCVVLGVLDGHAAHDAELLRVVGSCGDAPKIVVLSDATTTAHAEEAAHFSHVTVVARGAGRRVIRAIDEASAELQELADIRGEQARELRSRRLSSPLTLLEKRLVSLVRGGFALNEIAATLSMPEPDARQTLLQVLDKLGMTDRVQLAACAGGAPRVLRTVRHH